LGHGERRTRDDKGVEGRDAEGVEFEAPKAPTIETPKASRGQGSFPEEKEPKNTAKTILLLSKRVRTPVVATFVENQRRSQPTAV